MKIALHAAFFFLVTLTICCLFSRMVTAPCVPARWLYAATALTMCALFLVLTPGV